MSNIIDSIEADDPLDLELTIAPSARLTPDNPTGNAEIARLRAELATAQRHLLFAVDERNTIYLGNAPEDVALRRVQSAKNNLLKEYLAVIRQVTP